MRLRVAYVLLVLLAASAGDFLLARPAATNTPIRFTAPSLPPTVRTNTAPTRAQRPSNDPISLTWRTKPDSVDARLRRQPLSRVLARIAHATGWQVFVEPGSDPLVSAGFRDQPAREALDRLLAGHNYSLLSSTNGRTRLTVYRSGSAAATEEISAADALRIDNELVVHIPDGSKLTPAELARLTGGTVAGSVDNLDLTRLRYPDAAAADAARGKLASLDGIDVSDNHRLPNSDSGDLLEGMPSPSSLALRPANVEKGRLVIGLIDSAVQPIGGGYDAFLLGRESVVGTQSADPGLSHGTSMFANLVKAAEYAAGPNGGTANFGVVSVDVYGANESTTSFDVALGIQRAVQRGANVINLSLSSEVDSPFLHQLIRTYKDKGVLFLAAAGNDPVVSPRFPAAYPEVLAVTAGTGHGQFAPYANRGNFIDLMLPGSGIVPFQGDQWLVTGTSTSTAYASGFAGALWNPTLGSPANLEPLLRKNFGLGAP